MWLQGTLKMAECKTGFESDELARMLGARSGETPDDDAPPLPSDGFLSFLTRAFRAAGGVMRADAAMYVCHADTEGLAFHPASCWQAFQWRLFSRRMAEVRVECHAGYREDETPRRFHLEGKTIEVAAILGRWKEPSALLFRVQSTAGRVYLLRRDEQSGRWDIPEVAG